MSIFLNCRVHVQVVIFLLPIIALWSDHYNKAASTTRELMATAAALRCTFADTLPPLLLPLGTDPVAALAASGEPVTAAIPA